MLTAEVTAHWLQYNIRWRHFSLRSAFSTPVPYYVWRYNRFMDLFGRTNNKSKLFTCVTDQNQAPQLLTHTAFCAASWIPPFSFHSMQQSKLFLMLTTVPPKWVQANQDNVFQSTVHATSCIHALKTPFSDKISFCLLGNRDSTRFLTMSCSKKM